MLILSSSTFLRVSITAASLEIVVIIIVLISSLLSSYSSSSELDVERIGLESSCLLDDIVACLDDGLITWFTIVGARMV